MPDSPDGPPPRGTPAWDVCVAACDIAASAPARPSATASDALIPWALITELRRRLNVMGVDWQRVQRENARRRGHTPAEAKPKMDRCPGRARHWRIAFGTVGLRTPVCVYCGSPNPRSLNDDEWFDLTDWAKDHNVGDHVRTAIEQHDTDG